MHLKSTDNIRQDAKTMASCSTVENESTDKGSSSGSSKNNNNNNNDENSNSANQTSAEGVRVGGANDASEVKLKKQTLEQRKQELEKLLSEKSWLLQQIQKQETQIINGNYEYLNLNEIFSNLAQQYKQQEQAAGGTGILRRKTTTSCSSNSSSKELQNIQNNNRQSEISNRSSEYDNYPGSGAGAETSSTGGGSLGASATAATQQLPAKSALKKRATTSTPTINLNSNYNYLQLQRQHLLQQHVEKQMLQQHAAEQQILQQHLQYAAAQQQQQQKFILQHHGTPTHYHSHQLQSPPQRQYLHTDAISLYSVNSANVATLRQQHIAPQQQPIVVQCDKYYLSPTHQSYNDGGFIRSSQNIKKYISPMASPTTQQQQQQLHAVGAYEQHLHHPTRQLDAISLAPSYASMGENESAYNLRWRSQTNLPQPHTPPLPASAHGPDAKSHSSDMLAHFATAGSSGTIKYYTNPPPPNLKSHSSKPLDDISISSVNSLDTQKKIKPKQWLESSLDGPPIRGESPHSSRLPPPPLQKSHKTKLSSQSMSSGRHYSMSAAQKNQHNPTATSKLLQDDDGRYAKLSQSTSYLNSLEAAARTSPAYLFETSAAEIPPFKYLPPKPNVVNNSQQPTPPPRPPAPIITDKPIALLLPPPTAATTTASAVSPDIRIESPKNMTVVQQATFQPYKEVTKPFEMSDFYKYSTKFRQKETDPN